MRIGVAELRTAVTVAKRTEKRLKEKYPSYKGWLVFSLPTGQINVNRPIEYMLKTGAAKDPEDWGFPEMVADGPPKSTCLSILKEIEHHDRAMAEIPVRDRRRAQVKERSNELRRQLAVAVEGLEFDPATQIELRFEQLDYTGVVWPLQSDPLIDRERTTQTRASIRIVVGTVADLAESK